MRTLRPLSVGVAGAAIALVAAACSSGSSSSSTTTTQSPAQATAVITTNWTTFFDGNNPNNNAKILLLQNNGKLAATFQKNYAGQPIAAMTAAKVTNVAVLPSSQCQQAAVPSPCAKVSYDLVNRTNGSPLLAGQTGYATFVNGKWLVSENTFCALIALGGGQCPA